MPEPTRDRIEDALDRFAQAAAAASSESRERGAAAADGGRRRLGGDALTVLVLGTPGSGKSATANSLLNERVASVSPLQSEGGRPVLAARKPPAEEGGGGPPQVTVAVVDTPSLIASPEAGDDDAGGGVSTAAATALGRALSGRPIDAVLFVDRLDGFPVASSSETRALAKAYTSALGAGIWDKATIVLTHGRMTSVPGGGSLEDYAATRAAELRSVLRRAGARASSAPLPALLADNASRCPTNDAGEPVLLDGEPWLPSLWEAVVDSALQQGGDGDDDSTAIGTISPYFPDVSKATRAADPNRRGLWLIPVLFAAQVLLRHVVIDKVLGDDACRGDRDGPFPPSVVRMKLKQRKQGKAVIAGGKGDGDATVVEPAAAAAAALRRRRAAAAAAAAKKKAAAAAARKAAGSSSDEEDSD